MLIDFLKPPVTQGLFKFFKGFIIFKGTGVLLISFASPLLYRGCHFAVLEAFWKEIMSTFLKSLHSTNQERGHNLDLKQG